jgi:hypothetical protein
MAAINNLETGVSFSMPHRQKHCATREKGASSRTEYRIEFARDAASLRRFFAKSRPSSRLRVPAILPQGGRNVGSRLTARHYAGK